MSRRADGLTLIELIIAVALTAIVALGATQLARGSLQIFDSTNRGASATTIFSILGTKFRSDVQQAVRIVIASSSATSSTTCATWASGTRPLISMTQEQVDSDSTSATYGQPLIQGATGYEVRTDSASSGSIWRLSCSWDDAAAKFTAVADSAYRLALSVPPATSTADWDAAITCLGRAGAAIACTTDQFTLVAPNLELSTNISQGAAGNIVSVANDSSVLLGMQVTVSAAGSTVPAGTFVVSKSQGAGTLTLSKSVTLSGPDVPATLFAYSGLSLTVKSNLGSAVSNRRTFVVS